MAYKAKTDWQLNDIVMPNDMNRIESQLKLTTDKAEAALPSSSYTAADILNKLKTVDGNGSGLDTDLFKGESIIPIANGGTGSAVANEAFKNLSFRGMFRSSVETDYNTLTDTGYYLTLTNCTNGPYLDGSYWVLLEVLKSNSETTQMILQKATVVQSTSSKVHGAVFYRMCYGSPSKNWSDWITITTNKNIEDMMNTALQSGGVSVVKSIQRGGIIIPEGEFEASATITAVNRGKAVVLYGGTSADYNVATSCVQLLSSTKVTVSRNSASSTSQSYVPYQVIEFY